ncbi:MAG: deoxyribodipyrimidine photo-lyase [Candidatus Hydrogenedentes bacterium]|nr:deoxyribodipyrimidine photo-lyase [Candidatus Hydrogenedentota bacterium]
MTRPTLVWMRHSLRLGDHPALHGAVSSGGPVVPVFVWATEEEGNWAPGGAGRWWLHHSLAALDTALAARGSRLVLRRGPTAETLVDLAKTLGAGEVWWNRRVEPAARQQDEAVARALQDAGIKARPCAPDLLVPPESLLNKSGGPFQVFTPFWKAATTQIPVPEPLPAPTAWTPPETWPESLPLDALDLLPAVDWAGGLREHWRPGEAGAWDRLSGFLDASAAGYSEGRDLPGVHGTARISPHLHFGEISPRAVFHAVEAHAAAGAGQGVDAWLRQLYWREFGHYMLHHFPHTPEAPLRGEFAAFPWRDDTPGLRAWRRGLTGYPIVDAGLRELWRTGWMHNRVRMIAASFLVKDLLLPWQAGAAWFWDTLVDADLANNTLGWQWTAGCGPDAAPYFRVFNPVLQGEKFDPGGAYVRRWVPELAGLDNPWIHRPWEAPELLLHAAGVVPGDTYPKPIVEHAGARDRALLAYRQIRRG